MTTMVVISLAFVILYFTWPILSALLKLAFGLLAVLWMLALTAAVFILPFLVLQWLF